MKSDWYIVYRTDDGTGVMTVSGEYAETESDALRELAYSLPSATAILITQDPNQIPDDLDIISLEDAEQVLNDPDAVLIANPNKGEN